MIRDYLFVLVPITVGLLAELVKFLNYCRKYGWDIRYSISYGHMPSAHTAFAVSLVSTIGILEGARSAEFGIATCFAIIVIMDALRLRVYMGEQAGQINRLTSALKLDEKDFPHLKERVGHKPIEVVAGGLFGFFTTVLIVTLLM